MGRGRAKAKQQKVARALKYNSSRETDLDALQRELAGGSPSSPAAKADGLDESDDDDEDGEFGDEYHDGQAQYR